VLKDGARGSTSGSARGRLRSAFVIAQVAASIVLLVGGLLMVRSFLAMRSVDPGFDTSGLLTTKLTLPEATYPQAEDQNRFHEELLARLRSDPAIASAELVNNFPVSGATVTSNFTIRGIGEIDETHAISNGVTPGYFDAMGIPIVRGRAFRDSDRLGAQRVAIISQNLAERFFDGEDPIGKGIRFGGGAGDEGEFYEIVGVAADVKQRDVNQKVMEPSIYRPFSQSPFREATIVVGIAGDPAAAQRAVRSATRALDADVPIYDVMTVQEVLASAVWDSKLFTTLFAFFAAGALALASIGLYGVVAFAVAQRTHEIGVRVALGATARDVVSLVVRQGMTLTAAGVAIGMVLAFAVSSILESLLFGITARDPVTFTAVPLLLISVAALASWLPARRATRVDAMTALRAD
jgi:putative ABC transport system permease protein